MIGHIVGSAMGESDNRPRRSQRRSRGPGRCGVFVIAGRIRRILAARVLSDSDRHLLPRWTVIKFLSSRPDARGNAAPTRRRFNSQGELRIFINANPYDGPRLLTDVPGVALAGRSLGRQIAPSIVRFLS